MVKRDTTKITKLGQSNLVRIPAKIQKDESNPIERDFEGELMMEIITCKERPGYFIRKLDEDE